MILYYKDEILQKLKTEYPLIDKNLREMILFGSVARKEHGPNSDIDLLLITRDKMQI